MEITAEVPIPVTVVIRDMGIGGTERHLLQVLPRIDRRRFAVEVLALHSGGELTQSFLDAGIPVFNVASGPWRRIRTLWLLAGRIRTRRPILSTFLPEPYLLASPIGLVTGARALVMSRRSRNHYQRTHRIAAIAEHWLHRRMSALIGNSASVVADLHAEGAPPEHVRLIYNGIDAGSFVTGEVRTARRHALRAELRLTHERVVLTCVANLFPYKGHADLLEALALLGAGFSMRATLLLVGRDAGAREALEAQTARLGLSASVQFLGERSDVPDLLAASDIGVLASHEEGFSNAVIEGMAAGLPMVVSDVGGNAEAVLDGKCGYVVPVRDPAALAKALALLIYDTDRRQEMGATARCRVTKSFSLNACVAAYEALYEELWERGRGATYPN